MRSAAGYCGHPRWFAKVLAPMRLKGRSLNCGQQRIGCPSGDPPPDASVSRDNCVERASTSPESASASKGDL